MLMEYIFVQLSDSLQSKLIFWPLTVASRHFNGVCALEGLEMPTCVCQAVWYHRERTWSGANGR